MKPITGFIVTVYLAVFGFPGFAGDEGSWIADANGCKVRNPNPQPKETVTWSGNCRDGYAEGPGILQWFPDGHPGSRLEATFARGERMVGKSYSIKDTRTGSLLGRDIVWGIDVPIDKTYAHLTAVEQLSIKSRYEPMAESDEPPYPLNGQRGILEAAEKIGEHFKARGELSLAVTVNGSGKPIAVEVFKAPDAEMAKKMAIVLMLEKYKAAICNGVPCQMQYPFRITFH